ncbi:hypothetical protein EVAR_102381_1 [Eumeta japonica]|uniref:Uncharacterized protein n=1 Tax=Eumeta variegata TaxID=151549 RepID=A0A4C2ABJ8_EUMVA|nr:hypothetical protein EVAR_102381_1 [Eumeta japonica]
MPEWKGRGSHLPHCERITRTRYGETKGAGPPLPARRPTRDRNVHDLKRQHAAKHHARDIERTHALIASAGLRTTIGAAETSATEGLTDLLVRRETPQVSGSAPTSGSCGSFSRSLNLLLLGGAHCRLLPLTSCGERTAGSRLKSTCTFRRTSNTKY